jgi:serine/threonine protein kinase
MATNDLAPRTGPERIGRYQIIERIGRGAMGLVYRARDEAMGRDVALKVLTADFEDDPDIRVRFLREAEAAARLSHPNIITIFDVGEDGERFFIVMELLRGAMLKDFLKRSEAAPIARKIDLMLQLCAGLGAAHKALVYHRDIKPGNIFIRSDGILKILDFGVARLASSNMTSAGFIVGTPDYMSPEQARGAEIDARSDIFSLGGVFYFMLTGRKPFPSNNLPGLFHSIQNEAPPPIGAEAPDALKAAIMKALAKAPAARYQTCQELMDDLEPLGQLYRPRVETSSVVESEISSVPDNDPPPVVDRSPLITASSSAATEDTVDFVPITAFNTEDTVSLARPTRTRQLAERINSLLSIALGRLGWPSTAVPTRQHSTRKR